MGRRFLHVLVLVTVLVGIPGMAGAYQPALMPVGEAIQELETEHFRVLFQEPLADTAPAIAAYCEEAYTIATGVLGWIPREKTVVLYSDNWDTHNGWATAIPHNVMAIYAAGSEPGSSIYQPGDYLRRTIIHEVMHAFSMDMRAGYNLALSRVFGKVLPMGDFLSFAAFTFTASPMVFVPRWYQEGQSIWAETEFAGPGRGQSTLVDTVFRTAVRDGNVPAYSRWFIANPSWPYGSTPYLYGMRLVQYLYETSDRIDPVGDAAKGTVNGFVFGANRGARSVTGKNWPALASEMLDREQRIQNAKLETLGQVAVTDAPRLTTQGLAVYQVQAVGDAVYLLGAPEEGRSALYRYTPSSKQLDAVTRVRPTPPFGDLSATADGRSIFYTRLDIQSAENVWYEVRRYDTTTGRDHCVTREGRYRSVSVRPDGQAMAVISQRRGRTLLLEVPMNALGQAESERLLASVAIDGDLALPAYSPDGRRIAVARYLNGKYELVVVDTATAELRVVFSSPSAIAAPAWQPDGDRIVFGHDGNGVYNLYETSANGVRSPTAMTHVTGGLFFPSRTASGQWAAVGMDGYGPHLTLVPNDANRLATVTLPSVAPHWRTDKMADLKAEARSRRDGALREAAGRPVSNYNSFTAIRPDFWTPWLLADVGGVRGGLAGVASDPAGYQNLWVVAGAETQYGSPVGQVRYTYRGWGPEMILYGAADQSTYTDLLQSSANPDVRFDYAERTAGGGAAVSVPVLTRLNYQAVATIGYEYMDRNVIDSVEDDYRNTPLVISPTTKDESSVWGRLAYFSGTVFNRSVSIEDGTLASVAFSRTLSDLGGELDATRYRADGAQYFSMPFFNDHVLKLSASYGQGWGEDNAQGLFRLGGFGAIFDDLNPGVSPLFLLRGYDPNSQTGDRVFTGGVSYRLPVWNIHKGSSGGFPFYSRSLSVEGYYETGRTWDDRNIGDREDWLHAVGAEVNYGLTLFRFLQFAPGVGVVYAPQRDDIDRDDQEVVGYFSIKGWYDF